MKVRLSSIVFALLFLVATAMPALAGPPTQTLSTSVDKIIALLSDPAYKNGPTRPNLRRELITTIEGIFDTRELSRRALGAEWNRFSPEQQARFVAAFGSLLQNTYLDKIESYTDEKVQYLGEQALGADKAEVTTKVIGKGKEIPIAYRLVDHNGWKVYDVVIEGVSLVQNYRSQFGQILMHKAQWRLLPFLILLYIVSYLDRINVSFAALTMNRDLGLSQTGYGFGAGIFFLGYVLFEVPSNLILAKVGARLWIARIMTTWGLATMALTLATGPVSFAGLRFLLGVAEAGFFPGIIFYLTAWFPQAYRARAVALFMGTICWQTVANTPTQRLAAASDPSPGAMAARTRDTAKPRAVRRMSRRRSRQSPSDANNTRPSA